MSVLHGWNGAKRREVVNTDRQREIIRARMEEYYDVQSVGPRKATWGGICDEIFDHTGVHVRKEVVRKWVRQFVEKGRTKPLQPNAEELKAIVSALMHPDIDMLLPEELEDPEPPYRFLRSFLEFLHVDPRSPLPPPPQTLTSGVYESWYQVEDPDQIEEKWIKTTLTLELDPNSRNVRATETWEIHFRGGDENAMLSGSGSRPAEGWGIITPEGSLFLVMKTLPHVHNYYYLPVLNNSPYLALVRHEPSKHRGNTKIFEDLNNQMKSRTLLLHFTKVAPLNVDKGE